MYMAQSRFGTARTLYQDVELRSRLEGASPHALVAIMFDELLKSLEAMAVACKRGDFTQRGSRQSRAFSILHGLESSLDFDQGGEIAEALGAIYREVRRLTLEGGKYNDADQVIRARTMLQEIASAWQAIG